MRTTADIGFCAQRRKNQLAAEKNAMRPAVSATGARLALKDSHDLYCKGRRRRRNWNEAASGLLSRPRPGRARSSRGRGPGKLPRRGWRSDCETGTEASTRRPTRTGAAMASFALLLRCHRVHSRTPWPMSSIMRKPRLRRVSGMRRMSRRWRWRTRRRRRRSLALTRRRNSSRPGMSWMRKTSRRWRWRRRRMRRLTRAPTRTHRSRRKPSRRGMSWMRRMSRRGRSRKRKRTGCAPAAMRSHS
mmetsp:Transcript_16973/g.22879  ORF Transcript_16973/g.22879 Transcript_16973/m.22879 type:complete len:245 (-) Transcript_16973:161-895(-)